MLDTICTSMPCDKAQSWWKWFCLVSTSRSIFHGSAMYWGAEGALSSPLAAMNLVCKANSLFPSSQGAPTLQQPPSNLHLLHLPPVPSHGVYTSSTPSQNFIHRPTFLSVETTPMMLHLKIWLVRFCIICMFRICTSVYRLQINGVAFMNWGNADVFIKNSETNMFRIIFPFSSLYYITTLGARPWKYEHMLYECPMYVSPPERNPFLMRVKSELGLPGNMITPMSNMAFKW